MMTDFQVKLRKRNISEQELLDDLRRCAKALSKDTITAVEYTVYGNFGVNTFLRKFKQWNVALVAAGLNAPNRQYIPDAELFENLANVWSALGRQPYGRDLENTFGHSKFSVGTYEKRFGSWNQALLAFDVFIRSGSISRPKPQASQSAKRTVRKVNWRLRAQVLIRDNCICQMCGASPAKDSKVNLHADHVKPWSKGGETILSNLQTLCEVCNIGKSDLHESGSE